MSIPDRPALRGLIIGRFIKNFFDKDPNTRKGLAAIAKLSYQAKKSIMDKNFKLLMNLIKEEGKQRQKLFPKIVPKNMQILYDKLKKEISGLGMKACGAGGGGSFLFIHDKDQKEILKRELNKANIQILDFSIGPPIS